MLQLRVQPLFLSHYLKRTKIITKRQLKIKKEQVLIFSWLYFIKFAVQLFLLYITIHFVIS